MKKDGLKILLIVGAIAVLGTVSALFLSSPPPPPPLMPDPNGYDYFIQAGQLVSTNSGSFEKLNQSELQVLVRENTSALTLAREGIELECRVPLDSLRNPGGISQMIANRNLAFAFIAEGRLAEINQNFINATENYLETIHFANKVGHGGTLVDGMIGIAIESLGHDHLQKILGYLDAKSCKDSAKMLETLDSQRQTFKQTLEEEALRQKRSFPGLKHRLVTAYMNLTYKQIRENKRKGAQTYNRQVTKTRHLMIDLAARAYELEKGHPPKTISDLVPDYLKMIPKDPATGTNLTLP